VAHFARRKLSLRAPRTLELALGGDDGFLAWIDGREVAASLTWPGHLERQTRLEVPLAAGEHELRLKVVNSSGPGGFWCEIVEPAHARVPQSVRDVLTIGPEVPPHWQMDVAAPYMRALVEEALRALEPDEKRLALDEERLRASIATTLVVEERREPRTTHLHEKGSYLSPGAVVTSGVPAFLPPLPADAPRNRLGLARWLVSGANPLVARVAVNRTWERFFGRALVASDDDFGSRGEAPTHPELLDWLANDFVAHGWSVKHLCRTIASSRAYQQSSAFTRELLERDPENRLLARQARPRLEAETLRDAALAASGLLARTIGGPSVMPPQPDGVWAPVYSSDRWETSAGDDARRRGLYTFWRRSSPYATFQLFDAPSREQTCTRRARTNTPLQALALLNDPAFVECARALGERMARAGGGVRGGIEHGFRACTGRRPGERELALLAALHADETRARDAAHAWTSLAQVLLNLDEALTRP
jgi:hypothetical protein